MEWRPTPRLIVRPGVCAEYNAVFGAPVDPKALNLTDYYDVIKQPMDLGTVMAKLSR